jgi:hypothetical protein
LEAVVVVVVVMEALTELASSRWPELRDRLQRAAEAADPPKHSADAAEIAGRRGEQDVISKLEQQLHALPGVNSLSVFRGVRLPDPLQGGHKEIDVIAVSHGGICVIEVKNWSGRVRAAANGGWEQQRRGAGAECICHANPIELLQRKALLLHEFLAGKPDVELAGMGGIQCKLLMPNANLVVEEVGDCALCYAALRGLPCCGFIASDCAAFCARFAIAEHLRWPHGRAGARYTGAKRPVRELLRTVQADTDSESRRTTAAGMALARTVDCQPGGHCLQRGIIGGHLG